jgi:glycosyl transferase family 87
VKRALGACAALAAASAAVAAGAWFTLHSLQQDFAAYWIAATARRLGLDPYANHVGSAYAPTLWDGVALFRHSRFLYPPLVADLFRPLGSLPYLAAKGLFTGAMLGAWLGAGLLVSDRGKPKAAWRDRTVFFLASALFFPFYRHLERGQIDLLILLLLTIAWRERERAQPWVAGAALAAGVAFKPALVGLLPVVWAGGRRRIVLAAAGAGALLIGLTAIVDGPTRLAEYAREVLPRAALYGEGGTEEMLLPGSRFEAGAEEPGASEDEGTTQLDGRRYRTAIGDPPAAASLPRLLAPDSPSPASARIPFLLGIGGLTVIALRLRAHDDASTAALMFWATAVACVVTSPAGWVMGLVLALPLAPRIAALANEARLSRGPAVAVAAAWIAVALPAPFAGWAAPAGAALIVTSVVAARAAARPIPPPVVPT